MPKAAVLGKPIAHSRSPLLHNAAYRALGLPWTYDRHEVDAAGLEPFLREHAGEYAGLSLTMPLKDRAHELAEWRSDAAVATGAVNTLVFSDELRGYNTDVVGFREALQAASVDSPEAVTILGTGATARSAAMAMVYSATSEFHIVGRRPEALEAFRSWLHRHDVQVHTHGWDEAVPHTPVTISTTVAGATDSRTVPTEPGVLFECIYAPWPTAFAAAWQGHGGSVLSGLDLLVHQAAEQLILMTRIHADNRVAIVEAMYAALRGAGDLA